MGFEDFERALGCCFFIVRLMIFGLGLEGSRYCVALLQSRSLRRDEMVPSYALRTDRHCSSAKSIIVI